MNIKVTTDTELRDTIRAKLKENGGYCPCSIIRDEDHKCMCRDFIEKVWLIGDFKDKIVMMGIIGVSGF